MKIVVGLFDTKPKTNLFRFRARKNLSGLHFRIMQLTQHCCAMSKPMPKLCRQWPKQEGSLLLKQWSQSTENLPWSFGSHTRFYRSNASNSGLLWCSCFRNCSISAFKHRLLASLQIYQLPTEHTMEQRCQQAMLER